MLQFVVAFNQVIDIGQILRDLEDLRSASGLTHRDFGHEAGIHYAKVGRVHRRQNKSGLSIEALAAWLEACGSNMFLYFGQLAMSKELKVLNEDAELAEKFKRALKIPAKREALKTLLNVMFPDADEDGKPAGDKQKK